jgi:transketolase
MTPYTDMKDAVAGALFEIASNDPEVVVLSTDCGAAKFALFEQHLPEQLHNVGIAEQNAILVATGLAHTGKRVFVYGISNFVTARCYEMIKNTICFMELPVTILGVGAGYGYSQDGPTHHIVQDIAFMRALPGLTIYSPSSLNMIAGLTRAAYRGRRPAYVRMDKGPFEERYAVDDDFSAGLALLRPGDDVTIVATGIMAGEAQQVAGDLESRGVSAAVIDCYRLKPLNAQLLLDLIGGRPVVTLEEHTLHGGLGSIVCETLSDHGAGSPVKRFGIDDAYHLPAGSRQWLRAQDGLDSATVTRTIEAWLAEPAVRSRRSASYAGTAAAHARLQG